MDFKFAHAIGDMVIREVLKIYNQLFRMKEQ